MHMSDALLSPAVGGILWAATGAAAAYSGRRVRQANDDRLVPLMGVMGAFVFALQMINFAIPGTGSSGHIAGGMLLAILLGPHAAFLTLISVLMVQALLFADGGLLALGANAFNMAFLPCYIVYPLLNRTGIGAHLNEWRYRWVTPIAVLAAVQLGALGVVLETTISGIAELPFTAFALVMQPIHLAIGAVEGLITLVLVTFLHRADPSFRKPDRTGGYEAHRLLLVGVVTASLAVGGCLSWFAVSDPDGLEWSIARTAGGTDLVAPETRVHRTAEALQHQLAVMPDYAPRISADAAATTERTVWGAPDANTTTAGVLGGTVTLMLVTIIGWLLRRRGGGDAVTQG